MRFKWLLVCLVGLAVLWTCSHKRKQVIAPADTAPVAYFIVAPDTAELAAYFKVDAAGCADDKDQPVDLLVRWDWENDHVWDTYFTVAKADSHRYTSSGLKTITLEVRDSDGERDTLSLTVYVKPGNAPPTPQFAVLPQYGDTSTQFNVDASFSTDDRDSTAKLAIRWDWENDGSWDTPWSFTKTNMHKYTSEGIKTIRLEIRDADSLTNTITRQITVTSSNTAPSASFTINPTSGDTGTTFAFDASACSDAQDNTTALEVRWDWENDGTWDVSWTTVKTANHKYSTANIKTIRLEVRDSGGLIGSTTKQLTVTTSGTGNTAPSATFTVAPGIGDITTSFSVNASGCSDLEDNTSVLEVRWDWENDATWDTPYSTTKTAAHVYSTIGTKTIMLEVKDAGGLTSTYSRQVTVNNTAPMAAFTVNPANGSIATWFKVNATASSDLEDSASALQVRWKWEDGGTWTSFTATKADSHQYPVLGTRNITLEVKDAGGLTNTLVKQVSVDNTAPSASFTVTPGSGTTDTVFWLDASACSDLETYNFNLEVQWDFDGNGTWDSPYTSLKTTTYQFTTEGSKTIKLQVKDSQCATAITSRIINVSANNTAPTAFFTVTPETGDVAISFSVDASGCTDVQDLASALQVRWDWEDNGVFDIDWTTTKTAGHTYSSAGTYTIRMEVKDTKGLVTPYTKQVKVTSRYGTLYDARDGKTYKTVVIGTQEWMAENLNIGTRINGSSNQTNNSIIEKYAYNDNETYADTFGGLYQWDEMMQYTTTEGVQGICPLGWHIPTDVEWKTLEMTSGMSLSDANNTGWRGTNQGTQLQKNGSSGFDVLLSGFRNYNGTFWFLDSTAYFWTSSQNSAAGWSRGFR